MTSDKLSKKLIFSFLSLPRFLVSRIAYDRFRLLRWSPPISGRRVLLRHDRKISRVFSVFPRWLTKRRVTYYDDRQKEERRKKERERTDRRARRKRLVQQRRIPFPPPLFFIDFFLFRLSSFMALSFSKNPYAL